MSNKFVKGDTDPVGDCDKFEAGIHVDEWAQRIVVYGDTAKEAEILRDHLLNKLTTNVDESCGHGGGEVGACVPVLRAMARNYRNGHSWDHLDGKAVIKAADEITRLQARADSHWKGLIDMRDERDALRAEVARLSGDWADESAEHRITQVNRDTWRSNYHQAQSELTKVRELTASLNTNGECRGTVVNSEALGKLRELFAHQSSPAVKDGE